MVSLPELPFEVPAAIVEHLDCEAQQGGEFVPAYGGQVFAHLVFAHWLPVPRL